LIATEEDERESRESWTRRLLWFAGAASLLLTARRVLSALSGQSSIAVNHVSGAWAALAVDFSQGLPYRPLLSDAGYGGTRYFPLHLAAHGALIRLGLSPVQAGHAVTLIALAALLLAAFLLLRGLAVPRDLAIAGALVLLANQPLQSAVVAIRGDLLASALNLCGLALAVSARRFRGMVLASVPFALAILTKQTAVYGLLAATAALVLRGLRRQGLAVLAIASALVLAGVVLTQIQSQGRFFESLRAVSSGGTTLKTLAAAPSRMFSHTHPSDVLVVVLGLAGLLASSRAARAWLPALYLIATGCITLLLFGSPGIDENHFLDLDLAVVLFLVAEWGSGRLQGVFPAAALALASLAFCGWLAQNPLAPQRKVVAQVLSEAGSSGGPLLAENPWLPILSGERAYLQDAFAFRVAATRVPALRADLFEKLDRRFFRAVVLKVDVADDTTYANWYRDVHFGPGFTARLLENYQLVARHSDQFFIYRPKPRSP
jgi:hypothetical protein